MADDTASGREILFEMTVVGQYVKVVAIDALTGIEVSITGPAAAPRGELRRIAMRKLERRLAREQ
ncbi:hypothetical protein A33M_4040 [Rhodovulum sp. PH10]|uniref:DUF6898 family protein n=1 Tax=Rhodovulum sp. PH10 TaxID=1187851 RepID=UPI00027C2569|nr:hypothetical protein [Rhodovulum sp. PH10]EJW10807.1 hypothetical protein A33M_4040 [Rhodovulum sp. PH10]